MPRLALVFCFAALACVTFFSSPHAPGQPAPADGVAAARRAKFDAAKQAYDLAERTQALGLAAGGGRGARARRGMGAQRDLAPAAPGRRAADEAHLARVKPLLAR